MLDFWGASIQQNSSVLLFIHSQDILLSFEIGKETKSLLFQNGKIETPSLDKNKISEIRIKGELDSIEKLLKGQFLLRELIAQRQILVEASFRKILFLETLFQLGHSNFVSEISKNNLTVPKMM